PGPRGSPLLYAGERAGLRTAVLAFEPRRSDLPLQVAFPILLANLTGELLGGSGAPTEAVRPGDPVTLPVPSAATGLRVERPDGSTVDLAPGTLGGRSVTFSQTEQQGVYTATPIGLPDPSPQATASPSVPPISAAGSPAPLERDPGEPIRFTVVLFDVAESNIAPGSPAGLTALGTGREPGASPGPSPGAATAGPADRPAARDELWPPLLLIVLAFLMVEWAVYQRDALTRLWRSLRSRVGRPAGGNA
ncbi:MAG TPA: hypothetical protein VM344_02705, partial [Vitreimonas sp.]|nr:hypothetical protein [Vitreimonas sp.]